MESGKAVPFIVLDPKGKFVLRPEAKQVLAAINGPIAVVSVAGVYR